MTVTLVTVPDVPIVSTGTYQLASGEATFSTEDLADAVRAAGDPTVPAPRIKLGHNDARFDTAIASGELDGEPAFGSVTNLRLSDDGQTILGDYVDVPDWLADTLASSYPGRSIEGGFGYTAPSGRSYKLVIARVALLGITWPGVTSLADLREVLEQNGEAQDTGEVEAQADRFVIARIARTGDTPAQPSPRPASELLAGMDLGNVRMQFCGDLDSGEVPQVPDSQPQADDVGPQMWWWPRSVRIEDDGSLSLIVDDDEGHLIRIPFTVQQADLMYGNPELVIETYVPVTSDPDDGTPVQARAPRQILASWPTRASRPSTTTATRSSTSTTTEVRATMRINGSEVDVAALRTRLGLADDADEAAIHEALGIPADAETHADPAPVAAAAPSIPDGMRLVDEETLANLQAGAQAGLNVSERLAREERDRMIRAAVDDGKFPVSRREHYQQLWDADEQGTRDLIASLASGVVPVGCRETGRSGDGEGDPQIADAEHQQFMAAHYGNALNRNRNGGPVRQEA